MARENVEAFKRAVDAGIHGDLEALLKKLVRKSARTRRSTYCWEAKRRCIATT
jgi:hypothetical protein